MAEELKVRIKLLRGVVLGHETEGEAGEIVEVSPDIARSLIGAGQAESSDEEKPKPANGRRKQNQ